MPFVPRVMGNTVIATLLERIEPEPVVALVSAAALGVWAARVALATPGTMTTRS